MTLSIDQLPFSDLDVSGRMLGKKRGSKKPEQSKLLKSEERTEKLGCQTKDGLSKKVSKKRGSKKPAQSKLLKSEEKAEKMGCQTIDGLSKKFLKNEVLKNLSSLNY